MQFGSCSLFNRNLANEREVQPSKCLPRASESQPKLAVAREKVCNEVLLGQHINEDGRSFVLLVLIFRISHNEEGHQIALDEHFIEYLIVTSLVNS